MSETEFVRALDTVKTRLYRTAYVYLGNEADALDAVDEAVYKALIGLKKLRHDEYFTTWITRILINECKNDIRRKKRSVCFDDIPEKVVNQFDSLPLKDAIMRLPRELKEPVILRYFADYTVSQTAKALKIPQGTAATRIRRALKLLNLDLSEVTLDEQK